MTSENRNNRSRLYTIGGILMLAVFISMIIVLASSPGTVQDNMPVCAPVGAVAFIIAIILFILASRARRKQSMASEDNKVSVLVLVPLIIIGGVGGFLVSFLGYDYITCVIIGAALGATIWFIKAYRARRK